MNRIATLAGCLLLVTLCLLAVARSQPPVPARAAAPLHFVSGPWQVAAQQPAAPNDVGDFMRAKLRHSQEVLEGLALENFDQIAKHAQEMSLLSQAANWNVLQTPKYLQHSTEFRRAASELTDAARKKNLDGAALAYVQLTLNCVNCHKYVRNVRNASLPLPGRLPVDSLSRPDIARSGVGGSHSVGAPRSGSHSAQPVVADLAKGGAIR